jgi:23S rRNA pseudouridine1911/1915/1917 synthase
MKPSDSAIPRIQFCDNHLLIAEKPAGLLTQPDDTGRPSLELFVKEWIRETYHKPGNVFAHCIHRLDRPVAGLVLFARTSKALSRLNELSRNREIQRRYIAEVEGVIIPAQGTLVHFLIHGEHKAHVVNRDTEGAKRSELSYRVLEERPHTTVISVSLNTGRYHQIRAQFAAAGHPIVGDWRYGSKIQGDEEIHLACTEVSFRHPVTKEDCSFCYSVNF